MNLHRMSSRRKDSVTNGRPLVSSCLNETFAPTEHPWPRESLLLQSLFEWNEQREPNSQNRISTCPAKELAHGAG